MNYKNYRQVDIFDAVSSQSQSSDSLCFEHLLSSCTWCSMTATALRCSIYLW